jgi:hypothetical protein
MAMCGYTATDKTGGFPIPDHATVYDWLTQLNVRWRVY